MEGEATASAEERAATAAGTAPATPAAEAATAAEATGTAEPNTPPDPNRHWRAHPDRSPDRAAAAGASERAEGAAGPAEAGVAAEASLDEELFAAIVAAVEEGTVDPPEQLTWPEWRAWRKRHFSDAGIAVASVDARV